MTYTCFFRVAITFWLMLLFICPDFSIGQDAPTTSVAENISESAPAESMPDESFKIKLSVNEVRLDVVVLDKKGNPVTDLTVKDFEVFQNGARQDIISSVYIDNQSDSAAKPSVSRKAARNLPPLPKVDLKREDVRRSIVLVVDDLSMSFGNGYHAKMALRNFVEKQMQPGDMVAILRTGHGNSALQMFLSDKQEVLARINSMRMERALSPHPDGSHLFRIYDNQLSTLSYSLRALKNIPGRKIFVMMTATPNLRKPDNDDQIDFNTLYNDRFSRLADDALRAGIVINFLNINGLTQITGLQTLRDALKPIPIVGSTTQTVPETTVTIGDRTITVGGGTIEIPVVTGYVYNNPIPDASMEIQSAMGVAQRASTDPKMQRQILELMLPDLFEQARNADPARNALNPLPIKTGGVIIENSNFFLDGIGRETESLMKGYYLISYVPPADTFSSIDKEIFNQIKVNVKRRNTKVYTRDGFYNRLESETDAVPPAHPLQDAVFSPFMHADLNVNVAAGYVRDTKAGHFIHSWIHVDPQDVKIVETEDGGARIDLEMVCLTSDTNGFVQDFKAVTHTLTIEPENKAANLAFIQKHGVRFAMQLPVKKPGSYYVRVAVQDKESGKTGSAYQFVEILEPRKKGLALSNIFMLTSTDDLNWLLSGKTAENDEGLFFPVFQDEEVRSPALRTYAVGDNLQTMAMLYNAEEKAIADSEIEMQFVIYRDGKEFLRSGRPVSPGSVGNLEGIPLSLKMTMGTDIPPGDYVLEVQAIDKKNLGKREGSATQVISFTVTEN